MTFIDMQVGPVHHTITMPRPATNELDMLPHYLWVPITYATRRYS